MDPKEKRRLELEAKRKKVEDMRAARANKAAGGGDKAAPAVSFPFIDLHKL